MLRDFDDPDQLPEDYKPVVCSLWNTIIILAQNELPDIVDVWNEAYPDAEMAEVTPVYIGLAGVEIAGDINPVNPADIEAVIQALCENGLQGLAYFLKSLLSTRGYRF